MKNKFFIGSAIALTLMATHATSQESYDQAQDQWYKDGISALNERLAQQTNTNRAKNIILFIGDGMGISTITAARIFDGQSRGESGEENSLPFEHFPHSALVKTYNSDAQVGDSAGTASALNTGVKTRMGAIGTRATAKRNSCESFLEGHPDNLAELARAEGKSIGVVTTTSVADATPAAVYAHSPNRGWKTTDQMPQEAIDAGCIDISQQLINFAPNVVLGGGRLTFIPSTMSDPEYSEQTGLRLDNRNLTNEWVDAFDGAEYVWNKKGFDNIDTSTTTHLLGLFDTWTVQFESEKNSDPAGEPTLTDMTKTAIEILSQNDDGYYLMVEGGKIDRAHHANNAYNALRETQEFSNAVSTALEMVDLSETLIIVTADHSHVFVMSGYPSKGNPIMGLSRWKNPDDDGEGELTVARDNKPFTTLGYWVGPGAITGPRPNLTEEQVQDPHYLQQALIPRDSETHGGEDVAVFAIGPWSHLVSGVMEQNVIFHIMKHAMETSE